MLPSKSSESAETNYQMNLMKHTMPEKNNNENSDDHNYPSICLFRDKQSPDFAFIHKNITCGPDLLLFQTNFS